MKTSLDNKYITYVITNTLSVKLLTQHLSYIFEAGLSSDETLKRCSACHAPKDNMLQAHFSSVEINGFGLKCQKY